MKKVRIRWARRSDGAALLALIDALAGFEKLRKPTPAARRRLLKDAFGARKRFDVLLAEAGSEAVGYAIFFETYSSFRALPTLFLEDIFVLPAHRGLGVGGQLFDRCVREALRRGCGRMEWIVLDWNRSAQKFYRRRNARQMREWELYRLEF